MVMSLWGRLIDEMCETFESELSAGSLVCIKANEAAYEQGRRYTLGGTDMNRLWDKHTLFSLSERGPATLCYEEQRVLELAPILMGCDVILDIHSTTRPSPPFLLMRDDRRHRAIVNTLGVKRVVTGLHEEGILGGGMSPDVGLVLGEVSKRLGFTFEAGQHDDPSSWLQARDLVMRLLSTLKMLLNFRVNG